MHIHKIWNPKSLAFIKSTRTMRVKFTNLQFVDYLNAYNTLFKSLLSHLTTYPTPSNLNYFWGFGSILGVFIIIQILSGGFLSMHYICSADLANYSVEYILRDVNFGWFLKYCHSSFASLIFFLMYLHIGRGFYFRSFRKIWVWVTGFILYLLMMGISFLGYTLPFGQMSLWGATVITNVYIIVL